MKKRKNENKCTARDDTSSSSAVALRDGGNASLLSAIAGVSVSVVDACLWKHPVSNVCSLVLNVLEELQDSMWHHFSNLETVHSWRNCSTDELVESGLATQS